MALIIGVTQILTANQELELHNQELELQKQELILNNQQLTINKKQVLPKFKISYAYDSILNKDTIENKYLEIFNEGMEVESFSSQINVFFKFTCVTYSPSSVKTYFVPIREFYLLDKWNNNLSKQLLSASLLNNNLQLNRIRKYADELSTDNQLIPTVEDVTLIKINYKDILGDNHIEYYIDSNRVSEDGYKSIFTNGKTDFGSKSFHSIHITKDFIKSLLRNAIKQK